MDRRVTLLRDYYRGLPRDRIKVETRQHGFAFLEELLAGGAELEYGELTLADTLHKYKLARVPERRFDELLEQHVAKRCNVCLYFGARENPLFCFNLDNNRRENNTEVIPEMQAVVGALRELLSGAGCVPLVVASGRGFHVWCRLEAPVPNGDLHAFMVRAAAGAVARMHVAGGDYHRVKFNFYPDPRTDNAVSLRVFGSDHAKNRLFSRILGPEGLLDEAASWVRFEEHLRTRTVSAAAFARARAAIEESCR
jgi:hypothetical protein